MKLRQASVPIVFALLAASCSSSSDPASDPVDSVEVTVATGTSEPTIESDPATGPSTAAPFEDGAPVATEPTASLVSTPAPDDVLALSALHAEPDPVDGGRIVDARGREVLLRGVNVNAFAEYWSGNDFATVFPFTEDDAERISEFGWNTVRLLFSWSLIEPEPGVYDEEYIDQLEAAVRTLEEHGIYTILDSHQDAWGPTLAARPDEQCPEGSQPANGWDGAPGWATLVPDDVARCASSGIRETSPAVRTAFGAFFANAEGPGGVGIRTRYAEMFGHLAERFANDPAVAGYDIMNEPNSFTPEELDGLAMLYSESSVAIRASEEAAGGEPHLILFEPFALWSAVGEGAPPQWDHDDNVVYAPHIYQGAFDGDPITRPAFEVAVDEAAMFGGAPILSGEWGYAANDPGGTLRVGAGGDEYFIDHQRWQDEFHISATIWTWRESCGDPHKVLPPGSDVPDVAGPFEVDCTTNEIVGERDELIDDLTRAYPRAAPGTLVSTVYDESSGAIAVEGTGADVGAEVVVFYPSQKHGDAEASGTGVGEVATVAGPGGSVYLVATTTDPDWTLTAAPA